MMMVMMMMADFEARMNGCQMPLSVFFLFLLLRSVMQYTRASASDYDAWKTVHENPGWGSKDLIPFLRKVGFWCRAGAPFFFILFWDFVAHVG
jgi:hypothetical protein